MKTCQDAPPGEAGTSGVVISSPLHEGQEHSMPHAKARGPHRLFSTSLFITKLEAKDKCPRGLAVCHTPGNLLLIFGLFGL
jgi:hypothetical protein